MSFGIWIATLVVGEPSQPCGTLIVTTVNEPAAVSSGVTVTWALAGPASPRVINPAAAGTASRRAALRIFMNGPSSSSTGWRAYAASAPSPSRTVRRSAAKVPAAALAWEHLNASRPPPSERRASTSLTSRARRSPTARDGWSGSSKISWSAPAIDRPDEHREPCAERVCRRHLPADGQHVQAHRARSDVMVGAGQVLRRLDCHRSEQRVHTELRDPEAENHHRGADPTPEHGPGRGEDECTDRCHPAQ